MHGTSMTGCPWRARHSTLKSTCALWVMGRFCRVIPEYRPYAADSISRILVTRKTRVHFEHIEYLLSVLGAQRLLATAWQIDWSHSLASLLVARTR